MNNSNRGIVLLYEDLSPEWVGLMKDGGLNTIGVHMIALPGKGSMESLLFTLEQSGGRDNINLLREAGITVEYELHALEWLLPRTLFGTHPEYFRVNPKGERSPDCNLCPSNADALAIVSENAYRVAKLLHQDAHNYYLWLDDTMGGACMCDKCRDISAADQNMMIVNAIADGIRAYDSEGKAAYLAYADSLMLPTVKPASNVFLEFAPMDRDHNKPLQSPDEERGMRYVSLLDRLLTIFKPEDTHVLEYWLDNALYSGYKKPPVKVPFNAAVCEADCEFYASRGIRTIKSFSSFIGPEYFTLHGTPPISEYGAILQKHFF